MVENENRAQSVACLKIASDIFKEKKEKKTPIGDSFTVKGQPCRKGLGTNDFMWINKLMYSVSLPTIIDGRTRK